MKSIRVVFFILVSVAFVAYLPSLVFSARPNDWLKEAYRSSHTIFQEPYSSDLEADDVFQESNAIQVSINKEEGISAELKLQDNVVVRFSRFLMRMAIVISVAMLIFAGIKIVLAFGDSGKMQEALKSGGMVLLGVVLVLSSVAIVFLVSSVTRGSLDYELFNG